MKRKLSLLLIIAVVLTSCLYGCKSGESQATASPEEKTADAGTNTANTEPSTDNADTETPTGERSLEDYITPYDQPTKITVAYNDSMTMYPSGESIDDNVWTRAYKEYLNIDMEVMFYGANAFSDYETKLNLNIASGNIPDIYTLTFDKYHSMVESGALADMTAYYTDGSMLPSIRSIYEIASKTVDSIRVDGKIYGITAAGALQQATNLVYIRADWLEAIGNPEINTFDDLLNVMYAFAKDDPDQNGIDDTYGLAIAKNLVGFPYFGNKFMHAFDAYTGIWMEKNGQLVYGSIQPEVKDALATLNQMFVDGVLDPEFGVKDKALVDQDLANGKVGIFMGTVVNAALAGPTKLANPDAEWKVMLMPDKNGDPAMGTLSQKASTIWVVNTKAENPDALVKILNLRQYLLNDNPPPNSPYHVVTGSDGANIENHLGGIRIVMTDPYRDCNIMDSVKELMASNAPMPAADDVRPDYVSYRNILLYKEDPSFITGYNTLLQVGPGGTFDQGIRELYSSGQFLVDEFYGVNGEAFVNNWSTLSTHESTAFIKMIYGETPINAFDEFVSTWLSMGGKAVTDEVNEWYNSR